MLEHLCFLGTVPQCSQMIKEHIVLQRAFALDPDEAREARALSLHREKVFVTYKLCFNHPRQVTQLPAADDGLALDRDLVHAAEAVGSGAEATLGSGSRAALNKHARVHL